MKRFLCILLCFCMLLAITACGEEEEYRIRYDLETEPRNLDPQTAADRSSLIVINNIFEGLFEIDAEGEVRHAIALTTEKSEDGLTYTFRLDPAAQWRYSDADGEKKAIPVTAADFVFAFQRLLDPATKSPAASRFIGIRNAAAIQRGEMDAVQLGVYADDTYVLRFVLEQPDENFLNLLATTYAFPCNKTFYYETMGRYGLDAAAIMANGPFDISGWTSGTTVRLEKNAFYRNAGSVLPTGIILRIVENLQQTTASSDGEQEDVILSRLQNEYVDAALVDGKHIEALRAGKYELEPVENAVWGLCINTEHRILSNVNMRKAIAAAFDRTSYQGMLPENLSVATAMVPHGVTVFGKNYRQMAGENMTPDYNASLAFQHFRNGLAELNRDGYGEITLLLNRDAGIDSAAYFSQVSQLLQKEISLFLKVEQLSEKEFEQRVKAGSFDIALMRLSADDNTPLSILERFRSDSLRNVTGYANETFDIVLETGIGAGTVEDAAAAYRVAEQLLLEEAVFLPMYYSTDYFVTQPGVTGIVYNRQTGLVSFRFARMPG